MSACVPRRLSLAALSLAAFAGCTGDSTPESPTPAAEPEPPVAAAPTVSRASLRLNEIRFLPAEDAPTLVELLNHGAEPISLDGAFLRSGRGEIFRLPPGLELGPAALLVLRFDDQTGTGDGVVHAPVAGFPGGESGQVWLHLPDGVADAVAWGLPDLAAVDLCRGGRCASPGPGSLLARLPDRHEPFTAAAWAPLEPGLATPGRPNPQPPVSEFAAFPGMIFTASPRFSWYGVPGAARYRLQVARDEAFTVVVHQAAVEATPGVRLEQLSAEGPELPPGDYFWRVQAVGPAGDAAAFSPPMPFRVDPSRTLPSGATASGAGAAIPDRLPTGTPDDGTARSAAEPNAPVELLKVLEVPVFKHAKDTRMLTLEAWHEASPGSWDTPDRAGYPYCARAGVAMLTAYHGGRLSQDRIGYEAFKDLRDGPEYDLPVVGISDQYTSERVLPLALGTRGDYEKNPHPGGRDDSSCYDYAREQALQVCTDHGWAERSDECRQYRLEHEQDIACPSEIAYSFGYQLMGDIQREIDAGRPIVATTPSHLFLIVGYRKGEEGFAFFYHDAGGTQEVPANASGLSANLDSYWTGLSPVKVGSDEPELQRDSDGDDVVDFDETRRFGTDAANADSDGDGIEDKHEVRASVWDPEHGYYRAAASLSPTATDLAVENAAAGADISGRDFDADGLAIEMDADSDAGGCEDGQEDTNANGRRESAETSNFEKDDDDVDEHGECSKLWVGSMEAIHRPAWMHLIRTTVEVRLREVHPKLPPARMVGAIDYVDLVDAGSVITRTHSNVGGDCVISGHGTSTALPTAGQIARTVESIGPGGEIRWSEPRYVLGLAPTLGPSWTEHCPQDTWTNEGHAGEWSVNVGGWSDESDGYLRSADVAQGRMSGSYREEEVYEVRWSICRGGTQCPPLPELP